MATKRKLSIQEDLQRRVRPRREDDDDSDLPSELEAGLSTEEGEDNGSTQTTDNTSDDEDVGISNYPPLT